MNEKIIKIINSLTRKEQRTFKDAKTITYFKVHNKHHVILEEKENYLLVEITRYSPIKYEDLIVKLIRTEYSIDSEFAILRQRDTKRSDFDKYNAFVEACKNEAKRFVSERDGK